MLIFRNLYLLNITEVLNIHFMSLSHVTEIADHQKLTYVFVCL